MEILPPEYSWLQPIIVASIVVFFVSWIANAIFSANDFLNALLTAIIFGLIFSGLVYFGMGGIEISIDTPAAITDTEPATGTGTGTINSN
jgi:ribose/xylose/arabinose/galactoside ABC-type transport system permease subunit